VSTRTREVAPGVAAVVMTGQGELKGSVAEMIGMLRRWNLRGYEVRLDEIGPSREVFAGSDIAWASHLITRRGAYRHHGVYVGDGRVIQYTGYSSGIRRRPVEEVGLGVFAGGHAVRVLLRGASRREYLAIYKSRRSGREEIGD
jgi:Lecithin retinol acyltransferase